MDLLDSGKKVLFLIGPSGVGKTSVLNELSGRNVIELAPSWTTRPPRSDELKGSIEHKFISEQEFSRLEKANFFAEVMQLFKLPYRFGLPHIKIPRNGRIPTVVLRTYLVPAMKMHYPNGLVYALEDDFYKVEQRLHKRLHEGEPLGSRLQEYENEIKLGKELSKRTFSNDSTIESLADKMQQAIAEDFA